MRKNKAFGTGVVIAAVTGLTLALAGPATAASAAVARPADSAGLLTLCSNGYTSFARIPDRGGWSTLLVNSGSCSEYDLGGSWNEEVDVYEFGGGNGTTSASTYIGSTIYNGSVGLTIVTVPGPSFFVD